MRVLVAYASRAGSTKAIAEFIGEKLRDRGIGVDVLEIDAIHSLESYDAFVIGSAVYVFHWLKEARRFVDRNQTILRSKPVWIFSSGPTGRKSTDQKGRDLREVSGPKELGELRKLVNARDHAVFFGALHRDSLKGTTGWFARWIPKEEEGDFRNWSEIEDWADGISRSLEVSRAAAW